MTIGYTPWEDVTLEDSLVERSMRLNTTDSENHKIEIYTNQTCDDILAMNAALRNRENFSGSLWAGREYVKIAQIPLALLEKWMAEDDIDFYRWNDQDKARIMRRLNDKDWDKLRTAPGRI